MLNKNLDAIVKAYNDGKRGIILEGSSRSGKTWSAIDFLMAISGLLEGDIVVNIVKETFAGFKTTLYNDFDKRLPMLGLESPTANVKNVSSFKIFDVKYNFMGADQPAKYLGAGCDFFYINEALTIQRAIFDQLEQRCERFWIMDYNPAVSDHWIFNLAKRDDVVFVHSTMLDNPFIPYWSKQKILSYEPTQKNISAGTADDFMWTVYGLGLRASPQGVIFKNVTYIDRFPDEYETISYGLDFGFTNSPTAIVKAGKNGQDLYLESLFYTPCDNAHDLSQIIKQLIGNASICADSASPLMISELRKLGITVYPARKPPGSVNFGIDFLKQHKIHIVRNADFRREQENYKWREVNGIALNEPVDAFNHLWDATRYAIVTKFRY